VTEHEQPDEALIAMAGIVATGHDPGGILRQVLEVACSGLPGADEGGITLIEPEGPCTAIATSAAALTVDRAQYDAPGGGPGLEAYRRQQVLRIDCTPADRRWPEFAAAAAAHDLKSTLSVPLIVSGDGLGTLNLYSRRQYAFTDAGERLAANLGASAAMALANARNHWRVTRLADQLQHALSTRGAVDQAAGILIAMHGCTPEQALHQLSATAQRHRLTLAEVASDLVKRTAAPRQPTWPEAK